MSHTQEKIQAQFTYILQCFRHLSWVREHWEDLTTRFDDPVLLYYLIDIEELGFPALLTPPDLKVYPGTLTDLAQQYAEQFVLPPLILEHFDLENLGFALINHGYETIEFMGESFVIGPNIQELAIRHRRELHGRPTEQCEPISAPGTPSIPPLRPLWFVRHPGAPTHLYVDLPMDI